MEGEQPALNENDQGESPQGNVGQPTDASPDATDRNEADYEEEFHAFEEEGGEVMDDDDDDDEEEEEEEDDDEEFEDSDDDEEEEEGDNDAHVMLLRLLGFLGER
jgi:hypothetical protein